MPEGSAGLAANVLGKLKNLLAKPISARISTAVRLTGIPSTTLYELIRSGQIKNVKIDRSIVIPYRCLLRLMDGLQRARVQSQHPRSVAGLR